MTPPVESRKLAIPLALLLVSSLIVFTALASGTGKGEDCRGNSSKKPCPTIEPSEGATVRGTVRVRATVQQANADVAGITFEVDGDRIGAEDTTAPYELDWDTTKASNGKHGLTAEIRLADGSTSAGRIELSVDNPTPDTTAPTAQLTAPSGGSTVSGSVDVAANASDNVGVTGVQFKLDGANLGGEDTSAPYNATWNTTTSTNATHTLVAVARDAAGNTTTTSATTVTVRNAATNPTPPAPSPDTTAPSAQLTAPSAGSTVSASVNVTANASDNVGVAGVQFKLDGADLGAEDTSAPYALAWDSKTASNAQHSLTAVARDAAGNKTTTAAVAVTVNNAAAPAPTLPPADTTAPTTQLTAPSGGTTVSNSVNVTANASDNVGVAGVQFKLDGANLGAEDTSAPYGVPWDTKTASNAQHTLTAVARDAAGNRTTAANVTVSVSNSTTVPSSGSLKWPAPQLTSPQTIVIPERGGETWNLEAGKDYVIRFETGRRYGPLGFIGGRNIVLVGGEQIIDNTTSTDYRQRRLLVFRNQTGTIHIEGYLGTGPGLTEGINIWAPEAVLQIQKSRIENLHMMDASGSLNHPDLIQTWSGPREIRMWRFTGYTDYQGFLFGRNDTSQPYPGKVILDELNLRPLPNTAWGGKGYGFAAMWLLSPATEYRFTSVWIETGWWNGTYHKGLKDSLGFRDPDASAPLWSWQEFRANGTAYAPEHVAEASTSGPSYSSQQGDWIEFVRPSSDNIWNGDRSSRGRIYQGSPSGGDFAGASSVGRSYTP